MLLRLRSIAISIALVILCACEEPVLTQDAREHFVDGKPPGSVYRLANQIWEIPAAEQLALRILKDSQNQYIIRVGVMDNGVDLAHPDLVNQIDFRMKNGKIISAGYDLMGADHFAAPQVVRYEYYAFGAEGIVDHKIKNAPQEPLAILRKYDQDFLNEFIPKLQSDPVLKNTLFAKFTKENFSIIGAHRFALEKFMLAGYEQDLRDKRLLYPGWKPSNNTTLASQAAFDFSYAYIYENWELGEEGLPYFRGLIEENPAMFMADEYLKQFKGAKEFYALVKTEFEQFAKKSGYDKDFKQLVEFMSPRLFDVTTAEKTKIDKALSRLSEGLYFTRKGYLVNDPMQAFENAVYSAALQRKLHNMNQWPKERVVPGPEDVKAASREILSTYQDTAEYILKNSNKFTLVEVGAAKGYLARFKKWAVLLEEYLESKGWDPSRFGKKSEMTPQMQSAYRKLMVRRGHPILDGRSIGTNHGTHVAGTIAVSNPHVRISPIRVTLGRTQSSPAKDPELFEKFKREFSEWMHEPLVLRALEGRFGQSFPGKKGIVLADEILSLFQDEILADFSRGTANYRFLEEVEEAIKIAGREQLKLVNISLGMDFKQKVIDYRNLDIAKQVKSYYEFMVIEHFKWKIGKSLEVNAPGTLFLVATGNDGEWKNGRTKSGLPVELSSPFLEDYQDIKKGLVAPNNKIKNILGVGSISQIDELSSFTDILTSKTKLIFAHGEAVLAPIRSMSTEGFSEVWEKEASIEAVTGKLDTVLGADERLDDFLIQKYKITGTPDEVKLKLDVLRDQLKMQSKVMESVEQGMKVDYFLKYPNIRAPMTGTSMATPTLTGLLANEIQTQMVEFKIPTSEMYLHPKFMPETLINLVFSKAELIDKNNDVIMLKKWVGEKTWNRADDEVAFRKKLEEAKTKKTSFTESIEPDFCRNIVKKNKKWFWPF